MWVGYTSRIGLSLSMKNVLLWIELNGPRHFLGYHTLIYLSQSTLLYHYVKIYFSCKISVDEYLSVHLKVKDIYYTNLLLNYVYLNCTRCFYTNLKKKSKLFHYFKLLTFRHIGLGAWVLVIGACIPSLYLFQDSFLYTSLNIFKIALYHKQNVINCLSVIWTQMPDIKGNYW